MSANCLRLTNVSLTLKSVEVIRNFSLEVKQGEFVAVVGPSGCGKTTLLNLLAGFLRPSVGTIARAGTVRMVHQRDGLFPWLTAAQNIALGLRHIRDHEKRQEPLEEMLHLIGMQSFAEYYPHQLSGGMSQRVELARALISEADVLLMDEPFSALDYFTRLQMRTELTRMLQERPRTVIFVTHQLDEAAQLADRVVVLSERPARIRCEMRLDLPRPRDPVHPAVVGAVGQLLDEFDLREDRYRESF